MWRSRLCLAKLLRIHCKKQKPGVFRTPDVVKREGWRRALIILLTGLRIAQQVLEADQVEDLLCKPRYLSRRFRATRRVAVFARRALEVGAGK